MYNNSDWAWKYLLYLEWSESISEEKTRRKGLENENCFLGKELGGIALAYKVLQFHYSFFSLRFIYLFLVVLGLRWGAQASHCSGFSCCRTQAVGVLASVVAVEWLSNCGSRALEHWLSNPGNKKAGSGRHRGKCWLWDGLKVLYMGLGPRGMVWGARREEGSGWGTHVYFF